MRLPNYVVANVMSRVASPVIVEAKPGSLRELVEEYKQFSFSVVETLADIVSPPEVPLFSTELKVMEMFNMFSAVLPREIIFYLSEDRRVEKVYLDSLMYAFQYPTVPQDGIFTTVHRKMRKKISFTSTFWSKKLIGSDRANEKGYTGKNVKVAVLDTGVSLIHEQLRWKVKPLSVYAFQRLDTNGHGCVLPNTKLVLSNPGLIGIKEFYDSINVEPVETIAGLTKRIDKEVYTCSVDECGNVVKDRIVAIHKLNYNGNLIKITTVGCREIIVTPWHPILTVKPDVINGFKYKSAYDIKKGDKIVLIGKIDENPNLYAKDLGVSRFTGKNKCDKLSYKIKGITDLGDVLAFTVEKTEKVSYSGEMYDLTTAKYNNYYADGFVAHNTWVCGCVGGKLVKDEVLSMEVGKDIYCEGVAPNCELVSIKVLGYVVGVGSISDIIKGVEKALRMGVKILSLSLGNKEESDKPEDNPYYKVFKKAVEEYNAIPVVAAGNNGPGKGTVNSPGTMPHVLTVAAYDPITGSIANYSSRGPTPWGDIKPDTIAPGGGVPDHGIDNAIVNLLDMAGDSLTNRYSPIQGTSMATPHVSGLIACMEQAFREKLGKELSVNEVKNMLSKLGHEKTNDDGWGLISWDMFNLWCETEYGTKI